MLNLFLFVIATTGKDGIGSASEFIFIRYWKGTTGLLSRCTTAYCDKSFSLHIVFQN